MSRLHLEKGQTVRSEQKGCCSVKNFLRNVFLWYKLSLISYFDSKNHWLLVVDDSSDFLWSFFLKEKFNLADVMLGLIKSLKNKNNVQVE